MRPSTTVLLACLLSSTTAAAVVPDAGEILDRAAEAWPLPVPLAANLVEVREDGPPREAVRLVSDGAGHVRLEVQDLRRGETTVTRYAPAGDDTAEALSLDLAPAWVQWLVGRPVRDVAAAMGLDATRTSLDHVGGTILVVAGAGPHDRDAPRLAVERETGRLRGLVERERSPLAAQGALRLRAEGRAVAPPPEVAEARDEEADAAEEDPRVRWPARLVMQRGDETRTLRVEWLRMGEDVPAGGSPTAGEPDERPDATPAPPGDAAP